MGKHSKRPTMYLVSRCRRVADRNDIEFEGLVNR